MSAQRFSSNDVAKLFLDIIPDAMKEYRDEMRKQRGSNLTVPQFRILARLWRGPANNKELAEQQGVSVAAMSRTVDLMVERGLIKRFPHETDRRQVALKLTSKGQVLFQSIRKRALLDLQKRFSDLATNDLSRMGSGLEALRSGMKGLHSQPDDGLNAQEP